MISTALLSASVGQSSFSLHHRLDDDDIDTWPGRAGPAEDPDIAGNPFKNCEFSDLGVKYFFHKFQTQVAKIKGGFTDEKKNIKYLLDNMDDREQRIAEYK